MIDIQPLVEAYLKMRDRLAIESNKFKEIKESIESDMTVIESKLLQITKDLGVKNLKTTVGTVIQTIKDKASITDWDIFIDYVISTNQTELLTKAVKKEALKQVLEETGTMPPGVALDQQLTINIRRAT